jgi:octaprenyl-diphosphate synthase
LLHDDVLDAADVRRGLQTARVLWGNSVSVLAGDFMLTRSIRTATESGVSGILPALCETVDAMVTGEVLQLSLRGRSDVTHYVARSSASRERRDTAVPKGGRRGGQPQL